MRGDDAQRRLAWALAESATRAGCTMEVERADSRPWSSATFVGEQQSFAMRLTPPEAARCWLEALPDSDLPMRGHVAMPPAIDTVEESGDALCVTLSVLTLYEEAD